jgi:hypothetical protein
MVGINRRFVGFAVAFALLLTACTGGGQSSVETTLNTTNPPEATSTVPGQESTPAVTPTTTSDDSSTPTTVAPGTRAAISIDPQTGEPVESEVDISGPTTFGEVVDSGIDAGLWDEVAGLTQVLGYAVGAIPANQVPGVTEVHTREINEILERANALALSGDYSQDELADLQRWYEIAVPPNDAIELLADSATTPQALSPAYTGEEISTDPGNALAQRASGGSEANAVRAGSFIQAQGNCEPVVADEFSSYAVIEGCYEMFEDSVAGVTIRVLYPSWYNEDETLAHLPLLAREALETSVTTYESLGEIGDMTAIFSLVATAESGRTPAVATHHAQWATASIPPGCPITIFPTGFEGEGPFKQVLAHEAWHCVQDYGGFPTGVAEGTEWYHEGGAEYFSNVAYPTVDREHQSLSTFDSDSLTKPLWDLSYEAWVWWQFLANQQSPRFVADLQLQMAQAGDKGHGAIAGHDKDFQRFVVEYVAGKIADESGANLPPGSQFRQPFAKVTKDDKGKTLEFEVQPFVAGRFIIQYDPELRVFESDATSTDGEVAMVEWEKTSSLDEWKQVAPEVRSKCKDKKYYALAVTTGEGTHTVKVKIDRIEEASCDPCMLGTWDLDLDTFAAMILDAGADGGQALPPGTSMEFRGNYYTSLDDQGAMKEQRDGLVISMSSAQGSIDFTIDSYAEGRYTADGEQLDVFEVFELFADVSTSVPGLGGMEFPQGSSFSDGGSGAYECRTDDMTVTMEGFLPLRYDRVDKILSPPPTTAP